MTLLSETQAEYKYRHGVKMPYNAELECALSVIERRIAKQNRQAASSTILGVSLLPDDCA